MSLISSTSFNKSSAKIFKVVPSTTSRCSYINTLAVLASLLIPCLTQLAGPVLAVPLVPWVPPLPPVAPVVWLSRRSELRVELRIDGAPK